MRIVSKTFLTMLLGGTLMIALTVPLTASDPTQDKKSTDVPSSHDEGMKDVHGEESADKGHGAKVKHVVKDKYARMAELEAMQEQAAKDEQTAKDKHAEMAKPAVMDEHAAKEDHAAKGEPAAKDEHAEMAKPAVMDEHAAKEEHAAEDEPAAKDEHAEMAKPAVMDEHATKEDHAAKDEPAAKDEHAEMAKPAAMDEHAAKEDHAAKDEPAAKDDHAEMAKPAAKEDHAAKDDHAEMTKPAVMDKHAAKEDHAAKDEPAAKDEHAEMAKPAAMDEHAAKEDHAVKDESAAKDDHAEMAKPVAMDEHAAKEDHAVKDESAAKDEHAEMAKPAAMDEHVAKEDHAAKDEPAAKDEHAEMAKPAAMDEHAIKEDHAAKDEPAAKEEHAAKDEPAAKDEHVEMAKPAAMDEHAAKEEPAAKDEHATVDEHDDNDGHGAKEMPTAEEQFLAMEIFAGKGKRSSKNKKADNGEHGEAEESDETDEHGEAEEHAEESEHGEEGEHGKEVVLGKFETSLEPLPEGPNQPWRLLRNLQLLQDKIVQGKPGALANYRDALVVMSQKLLENDHASTWSHERNVMAAATYLLIGGDPKVGRHAFGLSNLSLIQKLPLAAAIAYVERKYTRAGRLLRVVDVERLPGSAKGQFALVQAMATPSAEVKNATGHLEQARRFSPGTLTEEAALRRLIRITAEKADKLEGVDEFLNHANAYFRHYNHSVYATDFLRNYGFGIVRTPEEVGPRALEHLKSVFPVLNKEQQVFLIAIVARNAVVLGRLDLGRWASNWLLENVDAGDKLHARIELYQIATSILDADSYADAAERLKNLPVKFLGKSDMSLYAALTQLSSRIGSELIDVERLKELTRIEKQSFPGDEPELPFDVEKEMKLARANTVLMRTEELLAKADRLLER